MKKLCKKCEVYKSVDEFHKNKGRKDGLQSWCKGCQRTYNASRPKEVALSKKKWYKKNAEELRNKQRRKRVEDPERILEYERRYRERNPEVLKAKDARRDFSDPRHRKRTAKRRAAKLQRTPPWSETEAINEFYANCPEGYHVDHRIPLQGETVSGLHVRKNLQYLPARENLKKGNRLLHE